MTVRFVKSASMMRYALSCLCDPCVGANCALPSKWLANAGAIRATRAQAGRWRSGQADMPPQATGRAGWPENLPKRPPPSRLESLILMGVWTGVSAPTLAIFPYELRFGPGHQVSEPDAVWRTANVDSTPD
jgi:hypothetical protein